MKLAALVTLALLTTLPYDAQGQSASQPPAVAFRDDVHASAGLTCASCHGPTAGEQPSGPVPRTAVAQLCARCHGDAAYMRRFDPQVRVDQLSQYLTSAHGKRTTAGDTRAATCSDCHGVHGVKRVRDARSPVATLNVTATCARCHGDPATMQPFGHDTMPPGDWAASVHAAALLERGDTAAPTCVSCHGSHGAAPPGVASVANVCAQCHARQAALFTGSPKKAIFDALGQSECLVCHGNHRIESPRDTWIGLEEGAVCAPCHDATVGGAETIRQMRRQLEQLAAGISRADVILSRAERAGMLIDDGRLALRAAREHQVQARVLVHGFAAMPFAGAASEGVTAALRAEQTGEAAIQELQVRRRGLAIATVVVLAFLVTLGLKIRSLPPP